MNCVTNVIFNVRVTEVIFLSLMTFLTSFSAVTAQPGHQLTSSDRLSVIDDASGYIQALADSASDDVVETYVGELPFLV